MHFAGRHGNWLLHPVMDISVMVFECCIALYLGARQSIYCTALYHPSWSSTAELENWGNKRFTRCLDSCLHKAEQCWWQGALWGLAQSVMGGMAQRLQSQHAHTAAKPPLPG